VKLKIKRTNKGKEQLALIGRITMRKVTNREEVRKGRKAKTNCA
jgi:hypothetical protein